MKTLFKVVIAVWTLAMALSPAAYAGSGDHKLPPDTSSPELQRIRSLEGRWTSTTSMFGKPNQRVYTEYEVTAGGSAVLERIFPGTPHEMISVYYDDEKGRLTMTHYCLLRNRPMLKIATSDEDTITMKVKKVEGLKSKDHPSMGSTTFHFKDKNHMVTTCEGNSKDKKDESMTMKWTRVK